MVHCPSWIKQSQFNRLSHVQKVSGVILSRLTWQWLDHKNRPLYPSGYYVSWGKKSKLWFRNFLKEWRAVICLRRNKIFFSWLHKQWDMKSANTYVVTKCVFEQLFLFFGVLHRTILHDDLCHGGHVQRRENPTRRFLCVWTKNLHDFLFWIWMCLLYYTHKTFISGLGILDNSWNVGWVGEPQTVLLLLGRKSHKRSFLV